jgi:VanZ family protein
VTGIRLPLLLLGVWVAAVALLTLMPEPVALPPRRPWFLSLSDLIRNLVLFVPLGAGLRGLGWRASHSLALAVALSLGIEVAQWLIPGRYSSPWDVLGNAIGCVLGSALAASPRSWLLPSRAARRCLLLAAAALLVITLLSSAWLFGPALPETRYWVHWAPIFPHLEHYSGRVEQASLGSTALPSLHRRSAVHASSETLRSQLQGDFTLRVRGLAGSPPAALAAILMVTDERHREIFLLGAEGDDLVFRQRTRARSLRLEIAGLTVPDALAGIEAGDPLEIGLHRSGSAYCLEVNRDRRCGLGLRIGQGWRHLAPQLELSARSRGLVDGLWTALLFLPLGFYLRRDLPSLAAIVGCAGAALMAPLVGPTLPI